MNIRLLIRTGQADPLTCESQREWESTNYSARATAGISARTTNEIPTQIRMTRIIS